VIFERLTFGVPAVAAPTNLVTYADSCAILTPVRLVGTTRKSGTRAVHQQTEG
jgi:hypothetical protein